MQRQQATYPARVAVTGYMHEVNAFADPITLALALALSEPETITLVDAELTTYARERKLPLLFGGYDRKAGTEYNSAILLPPSGEVAIYHKRILIPFGEYVSFLEKSGYLRQDRNGDSLEVTPEGEDVVNGGGLDDLKP